MDEQRAKSLSTDGRSRKRLRFASPRQRSKQASADVYRNRKRGCGGGGRQRGRGGGVSFETGASSREEQVHNAGGGRARKRPRRDEEGRGGDENQRGALARKRGGGREKDEEEATGAPVGALLGSDAESSDADEESNRHESSSSSSSSNFAVELDVALDRNGSEIFAAFHRDVWHLTRSLPELLHHADKVVSVLLCYLLSPESDPHAKSDPDECTTKESIDNGGSSKKTATRVRFVANHATTDVLHLLSVLAKDLRHEIHPHLHARILPRILHDLLSPPPPPPDCGRQAPPLDVTVVEAAFRALAYIFRYDAGPLLEEVEKEGQEPCLEPMRKYYGVVLAHRRDLVRRLAAEALAPLVRKLKTDGARRRHLRRVLRALVTVSSRQQPSPAAKRMQADAVDGIAQLFFQVSRGIQGQLHSKGNATVQCLLESVWSTRDGGERNLIFDVASLFLSHMCRFLNGPNAGGILRTMIQSTMSIISTGDSEEHSEGIQQASPSLKLICQAVSFKDGSLVKNDTSLVEELAHLLENLMSERNFHDMDHPSQVATMELLCSVWRAVPDQEALVKHLSHQVQGVLKATKNQATVSLVSMLAKDLLPHLPPGLGMKSVGSSILSAVSKLDPEVTIPLVHGVVLSTKTATTINEEDVDDRDTMYDLRNASQCTVSATEKAALLDSCLISLEDMQFTGALCAQLAVAVECAALIALVHTTENSAEDMAKSYRRVHRWIFKILESVQSNEHYCNQGSLETHMIVLCSIALECYSCVSSALIDQGHTAIVQKSVVKGQVFAEKHLLSKCQSIWTMKSVASFVEVLQKLGIKLQVDYNKAFESLTTNLRQPNHFLRLHTLEILASLPQRPFIVDHSELDLSGDLDEEPFSDPSNAAQQQKHGPTGMCNIMSTLLHIESTPLTLAEERHILTDISRVEVLGRTCRLPVAYAEAAASHLLGLLHLKFAPVWPSAIKALVALTAGHENSVWPHVHQTISELTAVNKSECYGENGNADKHGSDEHFELCIVWEQSSGFATRLFGDVQTPDVQARGSKFESTDSDTMFELAWSVIEKAPELMAKHSRSMVPIFLIFMQNQYFSVNKEDPDARELQLEKHMHSSDTSVPAGKSLTRWDIQRRLLSILKAFAAVNGPQQLVKHQLIQAIFVSLLNHPEKAVSQLAFACLLRFKHAYIIPYASTIEKLFLKGKLREALVQFKSLLETGVIASEHLKPMVPFVSRILFGRLTARAVGKSTKDSPAARRNTVLSFLSMFCTDDRELYPFLYLMVRAYIPTNFSLKAVETQDEENQAAVIHQLESLTPKDLSHIQVSVHQGFLNMLEAVISHFGHRITKYVPAFVSIIVSLLMLYEVKDDDSKAVHTKEKGDDAQTPDGENDGVSIRAGTVRSLCCRRLDEIFSKFHSTVDFELFFKNLVQSTRKSVALLPEMVINTENVPALLSLLVSISDHQELVKFLASNKAAVVAVLNCISPKSGSAPVKAALSFISNLLGDGSDDFIGTGPEVIAPHVDLLLEQFALRFEASGGVQQTWKQELDILFRVSKLVNEQCPGDQSKESRAATADSLSNLLLPFLTWNRVRETEQLNVLGILNSLLPSIEPFRAPSYYLRLSQLLGPAEKARPGIESKQVRKAIADVIQSLAIGCYGQAKSPSHLLCQLCSFHSEHVDEIDYDTVLPAINKLTERESLIDLTNDDTSREPSLLLPLVHTCFFFLYGEDGVVIRSAFKAIKNLVAVVAVESLSRDSSSAVTEKWNKLLHGCVLPITRNCLSARDVSVRRYFVLILREVSFHCQSSPSPHLHGDLAQLIKEDDPDLDFFLNITHVQVHRRARALQRLRKSLVSTENSAQVSIEPFYPLSLSNVLLPLALHPVYESKSSTEESLALEAIATVGAISRLLSWSKYNATLWTTLNQFHRHTEQERYVVGLLCAIIDGFHFDVECESGEEEGNASSVMKALENRIIPKVEGLLVKETKDRNGERGKTLRPSIVLALLKLFQKLPEKTFKARLPRLLTVICDILKSRESNARDMARSTLSKMAVAMGAPFLSDVIRELAITLTEGYQLHVRSATLHSILLSLSSVYKPPLIADPGMDLHPAFDRAVPGLMDLLQQDLFGSAQERKEAQDSQVRYVKEAGGSKSHHSLELISSMILFRPSAAARMRNPAAASAVHVVITPFLERLRCTDVSLAKIRRIRECLTRVVSGLARNPSLTVDEVLKFVYATITPFIGQDQPFSLGDVSEDEEDMPSQKPIQISGSKPKQIICAEQKSTVKVKVVEWRPSTLGAPDSAKTARQSKKRKESELLKVADGFSAPKLTGSNRFRAQIIGSGYNSMNGPASIAAVVFGLQLLNSALKKSSGDWNSETKAMLDPFVPVLTACICHSSEIDVVLLALKCLGLFLKVDLPSFEGCIEPLASKTLELLTSSGSSSNQHQEIIQASFKMLSFLMDYDRKKARSGAGNKGSIPLTPEQMEVLLSFLRTSVVDSDQHNPAMTLVKSIMSRKYISSELYDLMETFLEQSVRSPKLSLRQQSSSVFVSYLINYPLAAERVEEHLKQVVLNLKYEYSEGRLSAIGLLATIVEKLPSPVLEKHSQLFFLPLTLQLVNDDSKECREAAANCISSLMERLTPAALQSLCDYILKWSRAEGEVRRTAMQLFGILVDSRPDSLSRNGVFGKLTDAAEMTLTSCGKDEWEASYFALIFVEKAWSSFSGTLVERTGLWVAVVKSVKSDHPWVRLVSARVLTSHLASLETEGLRKKSPSKCFLIQEPGSLYEAARGFCHQLTLIDEEQQADEIVVLAVKALSWIVRAMDQNPSLCFREGEEERNPVLWVMTRLSNIAKQKGSRRRQAVYKCFAAFATFSPDIVENHLELVLEPLHRSELEAYNELELPTLAHKQQPQQGNQPPSAKQVSEECQLARDVLHLMEEKCDSDGAFLRAYGAVKGRAQEKKDRRKTEAKTEALTDPKAAAQRRIRKQEQERKRRKRRVDERRRSRGGGDSKRRHLDF